MINQIFDNFERTEFSDDIYSIFGRALTVATRFDASTKALARRSLLPVAMAERQIANGEDQDKIFEYIINKYKNLNRAIDSLNFKGDVKDILTNAREARNELIHEGTLGAYNGFDFFDEQDLTSHLKYIESLVLKIIKGDALVSTIMSIKNKEPISGYPFSSEYESKYLNWVMQRFET
ncbi:hypothetical protein [Vibrio metschnikovii]|uniref:hypothetical protein n=1 Tax=Vibrio metschnikovii TaxID=28172 RepID=UPI002FCA6525